MTAGRLDRIEGVMLGLACGDALGVPYEFGTIPLAPDADPEMAGGGLGPYAPGEYSDDTQMAVVVAQVAAARGLADESALDEIVEGWIGWLRGGATDVGNQTRAVLTAAARTTRGGGAATRARAAAADLHRRTGHTAGNGSLMRTAPVALAHLEDAEGLTQWARAVSDLTHADPIAGDACVLWCHAIRITVVEETLPDLTDLVALLPVPSRDQWTAWIAEARQRPPQAFAPNGFAPRALQAAWSAVVHPVGWGRHRDQPVAARLVSAVHAGNDTDTVAAIAGSMAGARWGAAGLPEEWVGSVHGWPGLDAHDLRSLARAVAGT